MIGLLLLSFTKQDSFFAWQISEPCTRQAQLLTNLPVLLSMLQWRQTCPVSDDNANDFLTRTSVCDVVPGQSGSAVWETRNNAVRAVAVAGNAQQNTFVTVSCSTVRHQRQQLIC